MHFPFLAGSHVQTYSHINTFFTSLTPAHCQYKELNNLTNSPLKCSFKLTYDKQLWKYCRWNMENKDKFWLQNTEIFANSNNRDSFVYFSQLSMLFSLYNYVMYPMTITIQMQCKLHMINSSLLWYKI